MTNYLAPWQTLPDNTFITQEKFSPPVGYTIAGFNISGFATVTIPFPTKDAPTLNMPCIAFNYLGQLTANGQSVLASGGAKQETGCHRAQYDPYYFQVCGL